MKVAERRAAHYVQSILR